MIVTNTETRPGGGPWKFPQVTVGLVGSGFLNAGRQIVGNWKQQGDATGLVSYDLDPNNAGEYYVWNGPDGRQYNFVVPSTGGPYTLGALTTTTIPAAQQGVTPDALTQRLSSYVPRPVGGDATGSVPTKQSDGSIAYAVPSGVTDVGY